MKLYHENQGSFECQICCKKFNQNEHLKAHQRIHDKNRSKPFKCHRCDYATDKKGNLSLHQRSQENQDKKFAAIENPLKCEKCHAFLRKSNSLYNHMKQVHPKVKFQCDLCGKYIKSKLGLTRHIKMRTCQKIERN